MAALHRYSSTCTKSTTIVILTFRLRASKRIRSIWWLAPSTSAIHVRRCLGSRLSASSKIRLMTSAGAWTMLAVSHLFLATGPGAGSWSCGPAELRMSAGVRGAGLAS